jgi:sortase (surface protein transpeptidase)
MGFTAWTYVERYAWQTYESWRFDRIRTHAEPVPPDAEQLSLIRKTVIGKINIPRLGISAILKEGVGRRTLNLAVGHIPSTALPGQPGNVGVAAHRDNLFRGLKDIRQDDSITLTRISHTVSPGGEIRGGERSVARFWSLTKKRSSGLSNAKRSDALPAVCGAITGQ